MLLFTSSKYIQNVYLYLIRVCTAGSTLHNITVSNWVENICCKVPKSENKTNTSMWEGKRTCVEHRNTWAASLNRLFYFGIQAYDGRPSSRLAVISPQQKTGERHGCVWGGPRGGRDNKRDTSTGWGWQILMTMLHYCMLLQCFHVSHRSSFQLL